MRNLLLLFTFVFGLTLAGHAQDASTPATPAAKSIAPSSAVAPAQPIAFNHKLHVQTAKMSCDDCHQPRGNGSTLAMPQPPKCMTCHSSVASDSPDIQRIAAAAKNEDPISWVRVYRVPSFVTFSHKTHTTAGSTCEDCHGPVAERTSIALEKDTSMGTCIACHQAKQAPTTCDTCHAIMSKNGRSPFEVDATLLARLQFAASKTFTTTMVSRGLVGPMRQNSLRSFAGSPSGVPPRLRAIPAEERVARGPHRLNRARGESSGMSPRRERSHAPPDRFPVAYWFRDLVSDHA